MIRRPPRSTLFSLHDALPICPRAGPPCADPRRVARQLHAAGRPVRRSEEHTSELQSQSNLVCRLLLEKKKKKSSTLISSRDTTAQGTSYITYRPSHSEPKIHA